MIGRLKEELVRIEYHPLLVDCQSWSVIINAEVFGSSIDLSSVEFEIKRVSNAWGCVYDYGCLVRMAPKFPSKELFLNVLAHELVHVWQYQVKEPAGHGPSFWKWDKPFKKHGLVLLETYGQYGDKILIHLAKRKGK